MTGHNIQQAGILKRAVYGPVPSWRLGASLGIDLISGPKTCSFECIYCQLGPTRRKQVRRQEFLPTAQLLSEVEGLPALVPDFVTFSGMGEPTLAVNLGEAITEVKKRLNSPVAVLTNSSLMYHRQVRDELSLADLVAAKLDASDEGLFTRINQPAAGIVFHDVVDGIARFRAEFRGCLALQVMFCSHNHHAARALANIIAQLAPDEVQLNTPLRPCPVEPLSPNDMREVKDAFAGLPTVCVYDGKRRPVKPLDVNETLARRPTKRAGAAIGGPQLSRKDV